MSPPKVTLTNWKRLNNSPEKLPQASAVQWNDHIFVLARDGTALLYHIKHSMWSALVKCTAQLLDGPPLAVYRGEIITVCADGRVAAFDMSSCRWKWMEELRIPTTATRQGYQVSINEGTIIANKDMLYAILRGEERLFGYSSPLWMCRLSYTPQSGWETVSDIENGTTMSAVIVNTDLYIKVDNRLYKKNLISQSSEGNGTSTLPEITPPPHEESTLHVVKENLFAFGGRDEDNQPSSDVLRYNPGSNSWESAGYMMSARYNVVVTTVQQDNDLDVFVFGGSFGNGKLGMRSKDLRSQTLSSTDKWDCSTCIVEKCMVE